MLGHRLQRTRFGRRFEKKSAACKAAGASLRTGAAVRCNSRWAAGSSTLAAIARLQRQLLDNQPGQASATANVHIASTNAAASRPRQACNSCVASACHSGARAPPSRSTSPHSGQVRHSPSSAALTATLSANAAARLPLSRNAVSGQVIKAARANRPTPQIASNGGSACATARGWLGNARVPRAHDTASAKAGCASHSVIAATPPPMPPSNDNATPAAPASAAARHRAARVASVIVALARQHQRLG